MYPEGGSNGTTTEPEQLVPALLKRLNDCKSMFSSSKNSNLRNKANSYHDEENIG
jgi:hypothetical protein